MKTKTFKFFKENYPKIISVTSFLVLLFAYANIFAIGSPYAPGATLDPACAPNEVNCFVSFNGTYFKQNGNAFAGLATLGTTDNNALAFKTNNTEVARFNTQGELLIGTTTDNGNYKLQVSGALLLDTLPITKIGNRSISIGAGTPSVTDSFLFGINAGTNATGVSYSNFLGPNAGFNATNAYRSNFLGVNAGSNAANANNSNFFGDSAGNLSTNAYSSNFLGSNAGVLAVNAHSSNFLGSNAGSNATNASNSNFFGENAGNSSTNSMHSNFLGTLAGSGMADAPYSNFIGYHAGWNSNDANIVGSNNIIIGTNISLPNGATDSINIGGVLFGTGTYGTTSGDPSVTPATDGKIGIGDATPTQTLGLKVAGKIGIGDTQVVYLPNQSNLLGSIIFGDAGDGLFHTSGSQGYYNSLVGIGAGYGLGSGFGNTALGYQSLYSSSSGGGGSGQIIAGGTFSDYNSSPANNIVGINFDGSKNNSFSYGSGVNSEVLTIVFDPDGKILTGGSFNDYNGTTANRMIRLNSDGSIDNTFGAGFDSTVRAIAIQNDGKILVGGDFTDYDGNIRNRIVRLNSDGSVDNSFSIGSGFNDSVYAITIQPNGKILVGGRFSNYDGNFRNSIIRLNSDGSVDNSFDPGLGVSGWLTNIKLQQDGKLIIVGSFSSYGGNNANYIARINSDGSIDNTFSIGDGFDAQTNSVGIQSNGKIIVGGLFGQYNGNSANHIARLNSDGSFDNAFSIGSGFSSEVWSLYIDQSDRVFVGGTFGLYDGTVVHRFVRLNSNGSLDNSFNTGAGFPNKNAIFAIGVKESGGSNGSSNVAIGYKSLFSTTTGSLNTVIGYNSGIGITTGINNTIIGANVAGLGTSLSNNIILADGAGNRRINVDNTGKVGINTIAPTSAFEINLSNTNYTYNQTFSGGGLNDATFGGSFIDPNNSSNDVLHVDIDSEGTPDTFSWYDDNGVCGSGSLVPITGGAQMLGCGITIRFDATTGHTTADQWDYEINYSLVPQEAFTIKDSINKFFVVNANAVGSNFIGDNSGFNATDASNSNFLGTLAGYSATSASTSNFIGFNAGYTATNAAQSNFFGFQAGYTATNAYNSNFIGNAAGYAATNSNTSNFIGQQSGMNATDANNSNFFGTGAGYGATNANNSNFFGTYAGTSAPNASYSNLFGFQAGENPGGNSIGSNNIIIGTNISLPNATANAINLGGVLFGTGTHSDTVSNPSITPESGGRIGIGIVNPLDTLTVAGNIGPDTDNTRDLGASGRRFANVYATNIVGAITPTGFTQGSVVFAGASGTLTQNNSQLFWNNSTNRLGIGTTSPSFQFDASDQIRAQTRLIGGSFTIGAGVTSSDKIITDGIVRSGIGFNTRSPVFGDNTFNGIRGDQSHALTVQVANANIAHFDNVGANTGSVFNITNGFNPSSGSGTVNLILANASIAPTTSTNTIAYNFINVSPSINQSTFGSGTIRGFYYNPSITTLNGSTHIAFENTAGNVLLGTTSGNVGIGTSNPLDKLDVAGNFVFHTDNTYNIGASTSASRPKNGYFGGNLYVNGDAGAATGSIFINGAANDYSNWIGSNAYSMYFNTRSNQQNFEFHFSGSSPYFYVNGGNGGNITFGAQNGAGDVSGIANVNGPGNQQVTIYSDDSNSSSTKGIFFNRSTRLVSAGNGAITAWGYGGTEVARLTTAGNLGIGTTTPIAGLQVSNSQTGSGGIGRGVYLNQTITAGSSGGTLVGLDIDPTFSNGAFSGNTGYGLRVANGALIRESTLSAVGKAYMVTGDSSASFMIKAENVSQAKSLLRLDNTTGSGGGAILDIAGSTMSVAAATYGTRIVIDANPNFQPSLAGIDVSATMNNGSSTTQTYGGKFNVAIGTSGAGNAYGIYITSTTAGSGTAYGVYSNSGKNYFANFVGIGTNNPTFPLDVSGNVSSNQTYGFLNSSGTVGTASGTNSYSIRASDRILASEFNAVSDARLKDVQFDLDPSIALNLITQLRPVSFTWKNNPTGQPILGFLAQDVETIIPNAVSQMTTTNFPDQRELSYNQLTAVAIGAIKELDIKVKGLESFDINDSNSMGSLIKNFLGSIGNSIEVVFFGEVHTKKLCLDDVCITKEQLQQLLSSQNINPVGDDGSGAGGSQGSGSGNGTNGTGGDSNTGNNGTDNNGGSGTGNSQDTNSTNPPESNDSGSNPPTSDQAQ